ncbi:chemotaxis protein CheB [Xanthomonas campestris]|uniref:chemotaxis protein CheB n=1 Tax=Xanthomonas campestris TaxID=339 RepID=UPI000E1F04A0|nr:chemotaxis protein CheB [Xanthomonas campestris]MCC5083767.1 chemotaxis protein CheB [Xanthomonas campestris]MCW2001826.1 two-component system chemotaxis response regulator CheB [Xanthomonas campestris]MEA9949183.1 chemotaxis protein CheB [Xanthomonas campestris pv. raphani]
MSPATPQYLEFDAIVIGASAGGVMALQTLLSGLPATLPMPVLVVLHLPRDRPSQVAELLDARCALPVREAIDKQPLQAGTVTIAPPDYHLLVEGRDSLALSMDAPVLFSRPAIDPLFESAADVFGQRLLAILLTGASSDGSAGVAAVRTAGGSAWIQRPDDAASPLMPASALAHAGADAVLSLQAICSRLEAFHA